MHRFFSSIPLQSQIFFTSEGKLFHQITHVFRAKKGDRFAFFEAGGCDTIYEIQEFKKKELTLAQVSVEKCSKKKSNITLFQAFPNKTATMEFIVQKLVEIGVAKIVFFHSRHSQIKEIAAQKKERIETIAIEALEQSGNNYLPEILYSASTIADLLKENSASTHIIGSPAGSDSPEIKQGDTCLWIGPEGGWSDDEIDQFRSSGCTHWSFAKNILRLETASIIGTGILSYISDRS